MRIMALKSLPQAPLAYIFNFMVRTGHRWLNLARINSRMPKLSESSFGVPQTEVRSRLLELVGSLALIFQA